MGTTLTGTTPQDTYDSLIKVTDNGPLSGSLKVLTDGLGNNSALSLSTGAASVTGTLAVSTSATFGASGNLRLTSNSTEGEIIGASGKALKFYTNDGVANPLNLTSAGNVGIGTSSPSTKLTIDNSANSTTRAIDLVGNSSTAKGHLGYFADGVYLSSNYYFDSGQNYDVSGLGQALIVVAAAAGSASKINFNTSAAGSTTTTQRVSIDADGLKFGADTAAANALDDYEEGTWTMGVSFGGASVGVTTSANTGTYTKIGRQVTVNGYLALTNKGSSTGAAAITGLPFTLANSANNLAAATLRFDSITFANQFQGFAVDNSTTIALNEITEAGVISNIVDADFSNACSIIVGLTYFV